VRKNYAFAKLPLLFLSAMVLAGCGGQTVPEHEHKWDEGTVTAVPNCHATGTKTYKCTVPNCQQTMLETLAMTPHKWNAGTITKPATCSEPGEQTFACENEGCEATKVVALPKGEHHYEETGLTRVPDLFEDGEMGYRCHDCGHESGETVHAHADFGEQFFSENWAIGHLDTFNPSDTFLAPTLVPFVAEKNAYENEHVKVTKDTIDIDAGALIIGYRVQTDAENSINVTASFFGVEATDKLASFVVVLGKDGGVKSVVAAAELSASWEYERQAVVDVANEDILALILNGGAAHGDFSLTWSPKCVHVFDQGKVKTPATCSQEGVYEYTCIVCEETKTRPIAKTEHTWNEGEVITPATEETEGVMRYTCDVCGETKDEKIPVLRHRIANFHDDFSTSGTSAWKYGYSTDYDFSANTFEFHALSASGDEYNSEDGIIIKSDWLQTEAEGKDLAVSYAIPNDKGDITVEIDFEGTDESTRLSARLLLLSSGGKLKSFDFFDNGIESSAWKVSKDLATSNGDVLYLILFRESDSWPQGKLDIDVYGPKDAEEKGGYVDLTADGVVNNEIDKSKGVDGNVWANQWGAHLEVSTACAENWPARMYIKTDIVLEEGHRYLVSMDLTRSEEIPFTLILANQYWGGDAYVFNEEGLTGFQGFEFDVPEGKGGALHVKVEAGANLGEITLNNLFVKEIGDAIPLVGDGEGKNVFNEIDKNKGVDGNVWANEYGAHLEVSKACAENWPARMYINTGVTLEGGKKYYVGLDVYNLDKTDPENPDPKGVPFDLILANQYWDGDTFHSQNGASNGHIGLEITVADGKGGQLFIKVEAGANLGEVTLSGIRVLKK